MYFLNWVKNNDGTESSMYQGVKITIYNKDGLFGYFFDNNKSDGNLGYISKEYAIEEAIDEILEGGA